MTFAVRSLNSITSNVNLVYWENPKKNSWIVIKTNWKVSFKLVLSSLNLNWQNVFPEMKIVTKSAKFFDMHRTRQVLLSSWRAQPVFFYMLLD